MQKSHRVDRFLARLFTEPSCQGRTGSGKRAPVNGPIWESGRFRDESDRLRLTSHKKSLYMRSTIASTNVEASSPRTIERDSVPIKRRSDMRRNAYIGAGFAVVIITLAVTSTVLQRKAAVEAAGVQAPTFEVDPFWPKPLPNHWLIGMTIGVSVDAQDHVWIVHRQGSLEPGELHASTNPPMAQCCAAATPVLEFDQAGNLLRHWGGPGQGYDWPNSNHGITIDYKGNVWIGGNGRGPQGGGGDNEGQVGGGRFYDNMVLKFTQDGKFLMQIGKPNQSKGSNDVENLRLPAKTFVDAKTNELYVADGYGNHRVIVYDAETGKYKRHWGAYGNKPDDINLGRYNPDAAPAQQFRNPVHCAELSADNLLYVCDRVNDRIQVFKPDGTFVKEKIGRAH